MFTAWSMGSLACGILLCLLAADGRLAGRWNRRGGVVRLSRWGEARMPILYWAFFWMALGVALRLWALLSMPRNLTPQETWTLLDAQSLLESGKTVEGQQWPAMIARWGGEAEGPLLLWLSLPWVRLLGQSDLALGLPMFLISCLGLFALWDFARRCVSERVAWWALMLCALSPLLLQQGRWPQSWALFPHLLMLALWAFSRERHRAGWALCGVLLLALSMYAADVAWYVAPLLALLSLALLCRLRRLRLWQGATGVLVFAVLSWPALATWATSVSGGEQGRALGLQVEAIEEYAHRGDTVWLHAYAGPEVTAAGRQSRTGEKEQALLYLPAGRYSTDVSMLGISLFESMYNLMRNAVLQSPQSLDFTDAYYPLRDGWLYFCSVPFTLLGLLLALVRAWQRRLMPGDAPPIRRLGRGLLLAVAIASLPLLFHAGLTMPHFAYLIYPMMLVTAWGLAYVAERVRLSSLLLSLLYLLNAGSFVLTQPDLAFTFPDFDRAAAYAAEQPGERVAVTVHLYPYPASAWVARGKTLRGFALDGAYVRGERELPGQLPYDERFSYVYFPSFDWSRAQENTVYILHSSEAYVLDAEGYTLADFGEYVVMTDAKD